MAFLFCYITTTYKEVQLEPTYLDTVKDCYQVVKHLHCAALLNCYKLILKYLSLLARIVFDHACFNLSQTQF